jgi:hypothetical protein
MNSARLDAHTPVCAVCAKAKQPATITLTGHTIIERQVAFSMEAR